MGLHLPLPGHCLLLSAGVSLLLAMAPAARSAELEAGPHFIGPLATPAPPLPKGRFNIEPYLVSTSVPALFDAKGNRHSTDAAPQWSTSVPIQYGVTDQLTVGATLRGQYNRLPGDDRRLAMGDATLAASLGLYTAEGPSRARLALTVRRGLATGRHDRLESARVPGSGRGTATTALVLHGQAYFLEGLLRARASAGWTVPGARAGIHGRSVYGTDTGFVGSARLAHGAVATVSAEYSVAPRWTLVGELMHERDGGVQVNGAEADGTPSQQRMAGSHRLSLLPAVQYHFSEQVGVIAGVQVGVAGRNTSALVAPQVAVNISF